MRVAIFCGGSGKRFWPLSRRATPKQFDQSLFDGASTFQMQVTRALDLTTPEKLFVSTNTKFFDVVQQQAPQIPTENIIVEPSRRDLAPAVGLINAILENNDAVEPYAILWSDHIVEQPEVFTKILKSATGIMHDDPNKIIFIGQTPRYAEENLGYIGIGKNITHHEHETSDVSCYVSCYEFKDWYYRPAKERAEEFVASGDYVWNTGYFVTTPRYLAGKYAKFAPAMYVALQKIVASYGTDAWNKQLNRIYPDLEKVSFDDKIVTHISSSEANVLVADFGWYDPGSLYALKKFLEDSAEANVVRGAGETLHSEDSLIFNHSGDKLVVGLGLDGHIIVNTDDVVLVVEKTHVPKVKELLKSFEGTENEKYL